MAQFDQHHRLLPGMKPRPTVNIIDAIGKEESMKSESSATFVFLKNCSNYTLNWDGKAAKIMCENCQNTSIVLSQPLISGTMEIYSSKSVVVKLAESCQIPIFQVDDSTDVRIEIVNKSLIGSIYFQRASDITVAVCGGDNCELAIDTSIQSELCNVDGIPQWVAHWNDDQSAFVTEKVKRAGIYPASEQREPCSSK